MAKFQSPRAITRPTIIEPERNVNLICNLHISNIKSISQSIAKQGGDNCFTSELWNDGFAWVILYGHRHWLYLKPNIDIWKRVARIQSSKIINKISKNKDNKQNLETNRRGETKWSVRSTNGQPLCRIETNGKKNRSYCNATHELVFQFMKYICNNV